MPIKTENRAKYPANWQEIRTRILQRAEYRCENCGVENYALGGRLPDGRWMPAWPLGEKMLRLEWPRPGTQAMCGTHEHHEMLRIVRIVLTIAHLDHQPENCDSENLRAWCQKCHLAYDHEHHQRNAYATRRKRNAIGDIFGETA